MTVNLIHLSINTSAETDVEDNETMHKIRTPNRNLEKILLQNIFWGM